METTANTEFEKHDPKRNWIGLFCFLTALSGTVLLYRDYQLSYESSGEVLATIERKDLRVRKRPSSSYVWQEASPNQDVRRKEYIQTGDGSAAIVRFTNGKVLELGENSLIFIDNTEDLSLSFLKGTGLVKQDGKDAKITKDASGKTKIEELSVQLSKPENLETILSQGEKTNVKFSWIKQGGSDLDAILEVASTPEFKGKTIQVAVRDASNSLLRLSTGKYYWRITSQGAPVSAVKQFNVYELAKINPTSPHLTQVSVLSPRTQTKFKWSAPSSISDGSAAKFQMELSRNEDFDEPRTIDIDPRTGFTSIQQLEAGPLFWRIKSILGNQSVTGNVAKLEVKKIDEIDLKWENLKEGSTLQLEQGKPIQISWMSSVQSDEVSYELKLKQQSGSGAVKSQVTQESIATLSGVTPGFYEVSLTAKIAEQEVAKAKSIRVSVLTDSVIKIKSPEMNKKYEYWDDVPEVLASWEKDPLTESGYQFIIEAADSVGFEKTFFEDRLSGKTESRFKPRNKNGKTFWRVKLINPDGQTVKMSTIQQFEVAPFPPPEQPQLIGFDMNDQVFKIDNPDQQPVLSWSKVDRAKKYELQVYRVEQKREPKLILDKETQDLRLALGQLDEGEYRFVIRAIDQLGRKGKTTEMKKFSVTYGNLLEAPESLTEEVQ